MSKARLVITALFVEGLPPAEVAARYDLHRSTVYRLRERYLAEGETALEPRSRRPHHSPTATPQPVVDLVLRLRRQLTHSGLDAGADTIGWHLEHHHHTRLSRATINRILARHQLIVPDPSKRPRSSYTRFEADQPNECWQSDFTHYRLADRTEVEIITWLDDHSRYALHISAHRRVTAAIVMATFTETAAQHGYPASTLTDNGMVYTVRHAGTGRQGGRTMLEVELRARGIVQKNSRPNHPTTCGKVERFQQTMKNWLHAQPPPATITALQALLNRFALAYNTTRPHRSLPHRATPATVYTARPKAAPGNIDRDTDTHDRLRHDTVDKSGTVTLRVAGRLRHIGIGRPHAGTHVLLLVHDLDVRVVNAATGELLTELTINPSKDYQPQNPQKPNS